MRLAKLIHKREIFREACPIPIPNCFKSYHLYLPSQPLISKFQNMGIIPEFGTGENLTDPYEKTTTFAQPVPVKLIPD